MREGGRERLGNNIILAPDVGESRPGVCFGSRFATILSSAPPRQINLNRSRYV